MGNEFAVLEDRDQAYAPPLPPLEDKCGQADMSEDEEVNDVELDVNGDITNEEIADLLNDSDEQKPKDDVADGGSQDNLPENNNYDDKMVQRTKTGSSAGQRWVRTSMCRLIMVVKVMKTHLP